MLPATDAEQAVTVLDRMRAALPDAQTCSVGVATWDSRETLAQLLQRADDAMYAAKAAGRDRVHTASKERRALRNPAA